MQKFREYIYCDEEKMNLYINQIPELSSIETAKSYERTTKVEGGMDIKVLKAGSTLDEKQTTNYSLNSNAMEKFINWVLNEKNAINYNGNLLEINDKDKLIVFSGKLNIPEMSENMEIINTLAKNTALFNIVPISEDDKKKMSFIKESDNVPILLETNSDYIFSGNLKKQSFIGDKDDFLDNIENDITVIGRIDKIYNNDEEVEIYDLAKEMFKINRAIRRKLDKNQLKDAIVTEKAPLVKITPLILYK